MPTYLDFEAPLAELEGKIAELRALATGDKTVSISEEVKGLEKKAAKPVAKKRSSSRKKAVEEAAA